MKNDNVEKLEATTEENKKYLINVMVGACFLGAGGGGGLSLGIQIINKIDKTKIKKAVKLDELPRGDNDWQSVIAGVGSPNAANGGIDLSQFENAYKALNNNISNKNKIVALTPVELGAANTIIPFYVASTTDSVVVIDGDTAGRAVPELEMTLLNLHGIPISPMFLAAAGGTSSNKDPMGSSFSYSCINIENASDAEEVVRNCISSSTYNEIGGLTLYPSKITDLITEKEGEVCINYNSVSFCEKIGNLFQKDIRKDEFVKQIQQIKIEQEELIMKIRKKLSPVNTEKDEVFSYAKKMELVIPDNRIMLELFEGTLTKLQVASGGFDSGFAEIEDKNGDLFLIYFKNENILAWDCKNQKPMAMAPDSICLLYTNLDGFVFPISNAEFMNYTEFKINDTKDIIIDVKLGSTITVFGVSAIAGMRSQKMVNSFMDVVSTFKPLTKYEKVEDLYKDKKQ